MSPSTTTSLILLTTLVLASATPQLNVDQLGAASRQAAAYASASAIQASVASAIESCNHGYSPECTNFIPPPPGIATQTARNVNSSPRPTPVPTLVISSTIVPLSTVSSNSSLPAASNTTSSTTTTNSSNSTTNATMSLAPGATSIVTLVGGVGGSTSTLVGGNATNATTPTYSVGMPTSTSTSTSSSTSAAASKAGNPKSGAGIVAVDAGMKMLGAAGIAAAFFV